MNEPPADNIPSPPPIDIASNYAPLILGTIALFVLVVYSVSHYGNLKTQPWYVSTVCIIGWCFPFWIVLLLPLDIASVYFPILLN